MRQIFFESFNDYLPFVGKRFCIPRSHLVFLSFTPRGGSRTAATSKMKYFVIILKDFQPLTIITKRIILDVAAVLDPPLPTNIQSLKRYDLDFLQTQKQVYN